MCHSRLSDRHVVMPDQIDNVKAAGDKFAEEN